MTVIALQTQEVAPMGFKRWPPPCGVALCSMWHFVLREWILEVAPTEYGVALSSIKQGRVPVNKIIL